MIFIPTEVDNWVPREDFCKCKVCGSFIHKVYKRCPHCQAPDLTPVPDLEQTDEICEMAWPIAGHPL